MPAELNADQKRALSALEGTNNIFLTGAAGSGKSFLLRNYLQNRDIPILASTGAAAILVGGRTFHSFFGLGIMEGGVQATVERALKNARVTKRIRKADAVIIDEISMISGPTLRAAETIARKARGNSTTPWGGMRIIAVGDFAQLPPVNPFSPIKEWAFLDQVWTDSDFQPVILHEIMRTTDTKFLGILNKIRNGKVDGEVKNFLDMRWKTKPDGEYTRLFPHRADVESYNLEQLDKISNPMQSFETVYEGKASDIETFRKHAPIPEVIHLKVDALVMLRQNDPNGYWVNGSLARVESITDNYLTLTLLTGSRRIEIEKAEFTLLNAEGEPVVRAKNFPLSLAWAMTIHKAQGVSLDRMLINLTKIWEPGQAYVALSRARSAQGLFIEGWRQESIFSDDQVSDFHRTLHS